MARLLLSRSTLRLRLTSVGTTSALNRLASCHGVAGREFFCTGGQGSAFARALLRARLTVGAAGHALALAFYRPCSDDLSLPTAGIPFVQPPYSRPLDGGTSTGGPDQQPFSWAGIPRPKQLRVRYCVRAPDSLHFPSSLPRGHSLRPRLPSRYTCPPVSIARRRSSYFFGCVPALPGTSSPASLDPGSHSTSGSPSGCAVVPLRRLSD